ncbi:MAG: UbiD family decarboxylase [Dehalococcoidia bacterium]|nr:UbiD family decarboxylase [Dehalococcoidia bacterium]
MKDLRQFIQMTEEMGELKTIEGAHWNLEIGAICRLVGAGSDPRALLFDKIEGYKAGYRILANPFCTDKRVALGLGLTVETSRPELVRKLRDKLNEPLKLIPPVEVKDAPILQNVQTGDDVDLFKFPTPKWQARDGGRYIGTGDNVIMKDPDEGWVNVSTNRVQIHDKSTATIYFAPGKHGGMIREKYWKRGQSCPVAITCGSEPLLVVIGSSAIPWGMPEYDYAGWWKKEPLEVIKGPTTGLPIPAHAEIALEGEMVPPDVETRIEGPFSEWTGHYSPAKPESAVRIKCVLHRNDPIILGVLPFLGRGVPYGHTPLVISAQVWNHLDRLVPGVKGVWCPPEFHRNTIVISLAQKYGGHAKQAALGALSRYNYSVKYVIVVDDDIDPYNIREVLFALAFRADPEKFDIIRDSWCDGLEPLLSPFKRQTEDITHTAVLITACKPYAWMKDFPPAADVNVSQQLLEQIGRKFKGVLP